MTSLTPPLAAVDLWRRRSALAVSVLVLTAVLATLLIALHPAAASAQSGDPRTWSIVPATADGPDGRAHLVYDAAPGTTVTDTVAVSNHSDQALHLDLYAEDAFTTTDGGFDLRAREDTSDDVGAWVAIERSTIDLAPGATELVPLTLTVPANAEPGDHVGGVVAALVSTSTDAAGQQVAVEHRVGTRIYLRVDGPLEPRLEIGNLTTGYETSLNPVAPGSATVRFSVTNTGNVRLLGQQLVTVTGPLGVELGRVVLPDLPELLPGATVEQQATVDGIWPLGRLWTHVTVIPVDLDGEVEPAAVEATSADWAVPWSQLVIAAVVAAGIAIRRRRRRRPVVASGPDPTGSGGGSTAGSRPEAVSTST